MKVESANSPNYSNKPALAKSWVTVPLVFPLVQRNHVVDSVVKVVNFIRARRPNQRQFITFLEETDAEHQELLYYSHVRWLSFGKVCQQV